VAKFIDTTYETPGPVVAKVRDIMLPASK